MDESRIVDLIAEEIRAEIISIAPRVPSETEYQAILKRAAGRYSHEVVFHGVDTDGRPFVEVQAV